VAWTAASRWRPFCSERCKLIDLGEWVDESRRIPAEGEGLGEHSDPSEPPLVGKRRIDPGS
jgi:endogenous inhibitor of DNA gyrase (YacG/DUF329 family)